MLRMFEELPVELMGMNVLSYLSLEDMVMLERACASKESHQAFMGQTPHCAPFVLMFNRFPTTSSIHWFAKNKCRISFLELELTSVNFAFIVNNIEVDNFRLLLDPDTTTESLQLLIDSNIGGKVSEITVTRNQNREVMEQLSVCTRNVKHLVIHFLNFCMDWLTADILSRWNLKEITLCGDTMKASIITLIVQTCTELTSIKLSSDTIDDAAVIVIAQHCPKLQLLIVLSNRLTVNSFVALSERGLPLEKLSIGLIPNIPTADIARRCSHALSCIRHLNTDDLYQIGQIASIIIPYMTGLASVNLQNYCRSYIPLLTQHSHKLTRIVVSKHSCTVADILSLCHANPLVQLLYHDSGGFTDATLIELIHACPHIHTLRLSNGTNITDIGILALSEHCTQLQCLNIGNCTQVTEAAVLQLLQRYRKLTMRVSCSSLSEETWTQLDKNIQKRVIWG